ncbi:prolyl endopeptidase [Carex littledalei]|uniref:Prolyl endopeptidase n=1 Tax=Carex littledalei TaxID=544730 RepID=A0A833QJJ5_9POAL|nr:prolyl endopeptidase [Carex littledalei]
MGSLPAVGNALSPLPYPPVRRDDSVVDNYHGVLVPDPYRWLEDPDSEEVKEFVEKQAEVTEFVLANCEERGRLREEITALFDHPRYDTPFRRGDKYFFFHNTGLQAQSVLYVQNDLEGEAEVLLDPNSLSKDGTVALSTTAISEDGKYLAYGISESGSDWVSIKVKFSAISWTHDSKGFFYGRYPAPKEGDEIDAGTETVINLNHELYYHFLGTDQSDDILCWKDPEHPKYIFSASVTDDGKYALLDITEGCAPVNKLYYCDLSSLPNGLEGFKGTGNLLPFIKFIDNFNASYNEIANDGSVFTFLTNKNAPKKKLVRVDLNNPDSWEEVVPEDEHNVLEYAYAVNNNQLLTCYMSDVKHILQVRDLNTGNLLYDLPLDIGSVSGLACRREDSQIFIGFTSFLTPGIIYKCDLVSGAPEMKIFREVSVSGFDRTAFEVKQVFVSSQDGTKIPMFIVSRKNITLDGSHPTLLYGYGGFNISITPSFSISRIVLTKSLGVVFCIANIRGGGEYGEEWHKAGSLANKQNCFDDFIASAEYLISTGYTNSKRLCIEGGSNGGLLVAACVNQRPDLFGCALAHVGVMDMLRFHKFTIGHAWTTDYGCSDKEEEFHWLIKYSPLHNVRKPWEKSGDMNSQYPSTMLLTADHDDRVVPLHSLKLLATMQYVLCTSVEDSPQKNPIIGRIDRKAGHGSGRPTQKLIDEAADRYSFMAKMLGI